MAALPFYGFIVIGASALTPSLLAVFGLGLGAVHGLIYPALTAFALNRVSPQERGSVMGWMAGSYNAGFALCVLGLGPVADRTGFPAIFLSAGVLVLTGVVPLQRTVRNRLRPRATAEAHHP